MEGAKRISQADRTWSAKAREQKCEAHSRVVGAEQTGEEGGHRSCKAAQATVRMCSLSETGSQPGLWSRGVT